MTLLPNLRQETSEPTGEAAVRRLGTSLEAQSDVAFALLFGSRGLGTERPDSDWDVGVFLIGEPDAEQRFRRRLELINLVEEAVAEPIDPAGGARKLPRADVVILNDASPLLGHRALLGRRLVIEDRRAWVDYFVRTLGEAFDEEYWRELEGRERRRRLAGESFGRP